MAMAKHLDDLIEPTELAELEANYGAFPRRHVDISMSASSLEFYRRLFRKRRGEVLFVLQRANGDVLLHTKAGYPEDVFRLPGGGIHVDELVVTSLGREVYEETSFEVRNEAFLGMLTYEFRGSAPTVPFVSYVFHIPSVEGEPQTIDADEKITGFRWVPKPELKTIAARLRQLDSQPWLNEWGRFRAFGHEFVLEAEF